MNQEQLKLSDEISELLDEVADQEDVIKQALAKINKANRMIRILEKRLFKLKTQS
jgi:septal ring factor EnvC (AmiA/AmiB activator)